MLRCLFTHSRYRPTEYPTSLVQRMMVMELIQEGKARTVQYLLCLPMSVCTCVLSPLS